MLTAELYESLLINRSYDRSQTLHPCHIINALKKVNHTSICVLYVKEIDGIIAVSLT